MYNRVAGRDSLICTEVVQKVPLTAYTTIKREWTEKLVQ